MFDGMFMNLLLALVLSFTEAHLGVTTAQAQDFRNVAGQVLPAVVAIQGESASGESVIGSGFVVAANGTIVTCLHLIRNLRKASVRLQNGDVYDSIRVKAVDERRDLAVIKVGGFGLPVARMGDSGGLAVGQAVVLIGSPSGLQGSVTSGIISAVRDMPDGFKVIQTDAAANPGSSGGPLVNAESEVVGVFGFKMRETEGQNFAIPINYVRGLLESATEDMDLETLGARKSDLAGLSDVPSGVDNLGQVKSIYVGTFGASEAAFLVREKIINRLVQAGFELSKEPRKADAILNGFVGADAYGRADATVFRLLGKGGRILWATEHSASGWGSASSSVAKRVVEDLKKAVRKAR